MPVLQIEIRDNKNEIFPTPTINYLNPSNSKHQSIFEIFLGSKITINSKEKDKNLTGILIDIGENNLSILSNNQIHNYLQSEIISYTPENPNLLKKLGNLTHPTEKRKKILFHVEISESEIEFLKITCQYKMNIIESTKFIHMINHNDSQALFKTKTEINNDTPEYLENIKVNGEIENIFPFCSGFIQFPTNNVDVEVFFAPDNISGLRIKNNGDKNIPKGSIYFNDILLGEREFSLDENVFMDAPCENPLSFTCSVNSEISNLSRTWFQDEETKKQLEPLKNRGLTSNDIFGTAPRTNNGNDTSNTGFGFSFGVPPREPTDNNISSSNDTPASNNNTGFSFRDPNVTTIASTNSGFSFRDPNDTRSSNVTRTNNGNNTSNTGFGFSFGIPPRDPTDNNISSSNDTPPAASNNNSGFSFGATSAPKSSDNKSTGGFSFGATNVTRSNSGNNSPNTGFGFSFGVPPRDPTDNNISSRNDTSPPASNNNSGFSFGATSAPRSNDNKSTGGFSFGSTPRSNSSNNSPNTGFGFSFGVPPRDPTDNNISSSNNNNNNNSSSTTGGFSFGGPPRESNDTKSSSSNNNSSSDNSNLINDNDFIGTGGFTENTKENHSGSFSFGASSNKTSNTNTFSFGASTSNNGNNSNSTPTSPANSSFSFGSSTKKTVHPEPDTSTFSFGSSSSSNNNTNNVTATSVNNNSPVISSFPFGSSSSSTSTTSSSQNNSSNINTSAFSFGSSNTTSSPSNTNSSNTNSSAFTFGSSTSNNGNNSNGTSTSPAYSPFSFGSSSPSNNTTSPSSTTFSFGNSNTTTSPSNTNSSNINSSSFTFGGSTSNNGNNSNSTPTSPANSSFSFGSSSPSSSTTSSSQNTGSSFAFGSSNTARSQSNTNSSNSSTFLFGSSSTSFGKQSNFGGYYGKSSGQTSTINSNSGFSFGGTNSTSIFYTPKISINQLIKVKYQLNGTTTIQMKIENSSKNEAKAVFSYTEINSILCKTIPAPNFDNMKIITEPSTIQHGIYSPLFDNYYVVVPGNSSVSISFISDVNESFIGDNTKLIFKDFVNDFKSCSSSIVSIYLSDIEQIYNFLACENYESRYSIYCTNYLATVLNEIKDKRFNFSPCTDIHLFIPTIKLNFSGTCSQGHFFPTPNVAENTSKHQEKYPLIDTIYFNSQNEDSL